MTHLVDFIHNELITESSGSLKTKVQETISCKIINDYSERGFKELTIRDIDVSCWGNYSRYRKIVDNKQHKKWLISWVDQYNTIIKFLEGWNNIHAVVYGDHDAVSNKLKEFHKKISKSLGVAKNDFDPTDIIIYDKQRKELITTKINKFCRIEEENKDAVIKMGRILLKELYDDKLCVGVSLKKSDNHVAELVNFEDDINVFNNVQLQYNQPPLDPVYGFFANNNQYIREFEQRNQVADVEYYNKIERMGRTNRNKSCNIIVNCDDFKNIKIAIRSFVTSYHASMSIEPKFSNATAQIGKASTSKWLDELSKYNDELKNATKLKTNNYNVDDMVEKFEYIKVIFPNIKTTPEQLRHLFEIFGPIDKYLNNELYSYYIQIHIMYAILNSNDVSNILRQLLLWAEKIGSDCLPYLLIRPA